jgi:hypothetical protein
VAEHEALIHGLRIASELNACHLYVRGDLELVVSQVMKEASCRDEKMVCCTLFLPQYFPYISLVYVYLNIFKCILYSFCFHKYVIINVSIGDSVMS